MAVTAALHGPFAHTSPEAVPDRSIASTRPASGGSRTPAGFSAADLIDGFPALEGLSRKVEEDTDGLLVTPSCVDSRVPEGFGPFVHAEYGVGGLQFDVEVHHFAEEQVSSVLDVLRTAPAGCDEMSAQHVKAPSSLGDASVVYSTRPPGRVQVGGTPEIMAVSGQWAVNLWSIQSSNAQAEGVTDLMQRELPELLRQLDALLKTRFAEQGAKLDLLPALTRAYLASSGNAAEPLFQPASFWVSRDSTFSFDGVTWTSWTTAEATGAGTAGVRDCTPDCAGGKTREYPAKLTLKDVRRTCGSLFFTTLAVVWPGDVPGSGKQEETYDLGPLEC